MNRARTAQAVNNIPLQSDTSLPQDVNAALRELVRLTTRLIEFADRETQALVKNDHLAFAYTQRDKEKFAAHYARASEEFRGRLEEFRGSDQRLLAQLDRLQGELREKTVSNNMAIDQIKSRAAANTQSTLFSAQEIGQRVTFAPQTAPQKGQRTTS